MPRSKKPGWIEWRSSDAREIILSDLRRGVLSLEEEVDSTEEAYDNYMNLAAFAGPLIVFDQFKERLKGHRKQVKKEFDRSGWEHAAAENDRLNHPRPTHNHDGVPDIELTEAWEPFEEDMRNGKNKIMQPKAFRLSREVYWQFKLPYFKRKIYQYAHTQKYYNYRDTKRAEKYRQYDPTEEDEESDEDQNEDEEDED